MPVLDGEGSTVGIKQVAQIWNAGYFRSSYFMETIKGKMILRLIFIASTLLPLISCSKTDQGPDNELPLNEVPGKILFTTGSNLVEMDIQSGIRQEVIGGLGSSASWSPDGNSMIWSDRINSSGALVYKITDNQGNLLFEFDHPDVHQPCWSPDGKLLAIFNYEKKVVTKIDLSILNRDTFKFNVGNLFWQQGDPDWSPDGKTFVFSAMEPEVAIFNLWRVDSDGANLTKLTNGGAWSPTWSPDGQEIAYVNTSGVRAMASDGSHSRPILSEASTPHWSADGKVMLYSRLKTAGVGPSGYEIRARKLETGAERLLLEHATLLDWHPME